MLKLFILRKKIQIKHENHFLKKNVTFVERI